MELESLIAIIEESGYIGLFLWLWLGIFGIPVPNEAIVTTLGFAASSNLLNPIAAFLVTYCGITAAITTSYLFGRFIGRPLLIFFERKNYFSKTLRKSLTIIDKYHAYSLLFSYFVPGIRNFVPFLYGMRKLPFATFALFSYLGVFIWLFVVFTIGYVFEDHIDTMVYYGMETLIVLASILVVTGAAFVWKRKRRNKIRKVM
ncbi:DedA family protein [Bacillus sp. FJAT-52991]|uniref:DedA family protein n=1 Tax=Bacillus kandeliae TaxID=3129297 RepID=A0ABZ2N594_9BACI